MAESNVKPRKRILVLVEGARTDVRLMKHLFGVYGLDIDYEVIPYSTNIYVLYNEMFRDGDPASMDIIQVLKARETNSDRRKLLDAQYTDVLLIFDLDPQDKGFADHKILSMMGYFSESSDMGKLYINYPMVEAFYHMKNIPDQEFDQYVATLEELSAGLYKERVNAENRNHSYSKFAVDRGECNTVIMQNLRKAWLLATGVYLGLKEKFSIPNGEEILRRQLAMITSKNAVFVLCTLVFFIPEYNPALISNTAID